VETEVGVVRSPRAVFPRGDESEVEFNGGSGEAPARCVIAVPNVRQPVRDPDSVVSSNQVVCGVAVALRQRVPHSGGLLGVVQSASFGSLSTQVAFAGFHDYMGGMLAVAVFDEAVVGVRVDALIRPDRAVLWR